MKAIQIQRTGGPEVLEFVDLPEPVAGPGQAVMRIEASGVNFIDTYFREGRYKAVLPYVLGQEAAGTVVAVGEGVDAVKVGDRVAWCGVPGTYAEMAAAPAARLIRLPDASTAEQGAAAILQGMTAHYLLHSTFVPKAGDPVLIHAGAGGTGLLLIQMAKRLGARVLTTVSTDEKAELARAAGANEVILYTRESVRDRVMELTDGAKVPVVYDSVGKATFEESLGCLRTRGTLVLFGGASGAVPPFDLIRLSEMGSLYVTRPTLKDYVVTREELQARADDVFGWVASGELNVRIGHRFALKDAAEAQRELAGRRTTGKVLLIP